MPTTILRRNTSFRLRTDLLERLKRSAERENRTLNNYVENVLLDIEYHEPNDVTKAAIEEATSRTSYPADELYSNAEELFKALDSE
jgi:predicted DNA-binding protein